MCQTNVFFCFSICCTLLVRRAVLSLSVFPAQLFQSIYFLVQIVSSSSVSLMHVGPALSLSLNLSNRAYDQSKCISTGDFFHLIATGQHLAIYFLMQPSKQIRFKPKIFKTFYHVTCQKSLVPAMKSIN